MTGRYDHIAKRLNESATYAQIGLELGVTRQRVHQIWRAGKDNSGPKYRAKLNRWAVPVIKALRVERGLSVPLMSNMSGVHKATLYKLEYSSGPTIQRRTAYALARALGVPVDTVFDLAVPQTDLLAATPCQ